MNLKEVVESIEKEYIKRICSNWEKFCFSNNLLTKERSYLLGKDLERQYLMNRPISSFIKNKELNNDNVLFLLQNAINEEVEKYGFTQYVLRDTFARFDLSDDESEEYYDAYGYQCELFKLILKSIAVFLLDGKIQYFDS
jgi:hypothetical protein